MTNHAPTRPSGDEAVRTALQSLVTLYEQHDPRGVSLSEIARDIRVSTTQLSRILLGTRKIHPTQICDLRQRAYDAVMEAMRAVRECVHPVEPKSLVRECIETICRGADSQSAVGKAIADNEVTADEWPGVRQALVTDVAHKRALIVSGDAKFAANFVRAQLKAVAG